LTPASGDGRRVELLRSAARVAARRGAPGAAAARLRRALEESPEDHERAEILSELGTFELAAMQFEAAEEHLRATLSSDADPMVRADAASMLGRCAIASGGRSAEPALDALASLAERLRLIDPERALELGSELLMLATAVPRLRAGLAEHLQRFREHAAGHPGFEAVARIHTAQEGLVQGGSAAAALEEVNAALATGLPPGAATNATFLALLALEQGEQYDQALRVLDLALEGARREGHATRQGVIHCRRAVIALAQGSLHDAQVEADTGMLLVERQHFVLPQLLAVAIVVQMERGDLAAAAELAQTGDSLGVAEDRLFLDHYLTARGRLRIAQGQVREGVADLIWCGERLEAYHVSWPGDWKAFAAPALAALGESQEAVRLAREHLAVARRVGARGGLGRALCSAGIAIGGGEGLDLLEEAVATLERSHARLELAHALVDLGAALGGAGRRREARDAQRRAIELADECGATALAERARAELHSGPGRRPRAELTGPGALTAAEWRVCRQVAEGRTNREVAQALFVTEKTVERHLSSAYQKLGIRSRFQLPAAIG
jgi:DNA-binding CsgD family transcriptional regulator